MFQPATTLAVRLLCITREIPMPFDLQLIDLPFRMQPGLRKLGMNARHLHALQPDSALFSARQQVSRAGQALHVAPGFDAGPALDAIWRQARRDGITTPDPALPLELALAQDLAVLDLASLSVPWMCVCLPSGWAPEEKIGRTMAQIHAPVADSDALNSRWAQLARLVSAGQAWERQVWTISPSSRLDQHPHRHPPAPWPDTGDLSTFAGQCYLRSEYQTFFPVPDPAGRPSGQAVFTITVAQQPLSEAVCTPADAVRLRESLASMSDAVLQYKRLQPARTRLLAWLSQQAPATPPAPVQNV